MSNYVEWEMQGVEFVNCNCAFGCPCQFNSLPTYGNCRAAGFVQIEKGHFGNVPLDGLRWGAVLEWPAAIHLGNGKMQTIIDERANPLQRKAIETVSHGGETEPGSLIWQVFSTTMTEFLPTVYKPINLNIDLAARSAQITVPGMVESHGTSILNPITKAPHAVRISNPKGFEFTDSEVVSGTSKASGAIRIDNEGTHAHIARIHWSNRGVVR